MGKESRLVPERTAGGQRRYPLSALRPHLVRTEKIDRKTLCYARVSSHDQRQDLERQKQVLEMYCAAQGWKFETIADLGSGMTRVTQFAGEERRDKVRGNIY
ncbi:hypothetical protein Bealeia2_01960 (plasmid) [Candidatus Bealeia paramacronuclearis]|nr:hypothetical protein [Candidatus Bealeia paramacronuclearis]